MLHVGYVHCTISIIDGLTMKAAYFESKFTL